MGLGLVSLSKRVKIFFRGGKKEVHYVWYLNDLEGILAQTNSSHAVIFSLITPYWNSGFSFWLIILIYYFCLLTCYLFILKFWTTIMFILNADILCKCMMFFSWKQVLSQSEGFMPMIRTLGKSVVPFPWCDPLNHCLKLKYSMIWNRHSLTLFAYISFHKQEKTYLCSWEFLVWHRKKRLE